MMKKQNQEATDSSQANQPVSSKSEDADESRWVWCDYCDSDLDLDDKEVAQGWYICPECGQLSHLRDPRDEGDDSALETPTSDDVEWVQLAEFVGAEEAALVVSYLRANGIEAFVWQGGTGQAFDWSIRISGPSHVMVRADQERIARSLRGNLVECEHCKEALELTDQEVIQGWFVCPACQDINYPGDSVTCMSCGSRLQLDQAEREQGWYCCPECDQLTHLTDLSDDDEDPALESLVEENTVDWVQLKEVTGDEEATQVVCYLRTNGIEAQAWYEARAGRVSGSSAGKLQASYIMVPEDQIELAHLLLAKEID